MLHSDALRRIIARDPARLDALAVLRASGPPDAWIGAGFIRDAVWAHLTGIDRPRLQADVDVLWFDASAPEREIDRRYEGHLRTLAPDIRWSVKNQARMHLRNGDRPYRSVADAMTHWPETATAVAMRLSSGDDLEIEAPFGLDDLFQLRLRPTARFTGEKRVIFDQRAAEKGWLQRFPGLRVEG